MELSVVIHYKSIDSEEGESLANAEAAVCSEFTPWKKRCSPLSILSQQERMGINQLYSAALWDRLCQHPQTHFISFHVSEQQTATNF